MPRFEPEEFLRLIEDQQMVTIFMVPTMFVRLLKLPAEVRKKYDLSSLRTSSMPPRPVLWMSNAR